jgi:hypothetical protein
LSENIFLRAGLEKVFIERAKRDSDNVMEDEYLMWPHAYISLELLRLGYLPYKMSGLSLRAAAISEKDWNGGSGIFSVLGPLVQLLRNYRELAHFKADMAILNRSIVSWVIQDRLESKYRAPVALLRQMIGRLGSRSIGTVVMISLLYSLPRWILLTSAWALKHKGRSNLN